MLVCVLTESKSFNFLDSEEEKSEEEAREDFTKMKAAKEESRPSKKVRKSTYYMKLLKIFLFILFYTHVCPH